MVVLVSKFFSIGVAFVNQMAEPIPIAVIIFLSCLALMIAFTFPKKEVLDKMTIELKEDQRRFKKEAIQALLVEKEKIASQITLEKQNMGEEKYN